MEDLLNLGFPKIVTPDSFNWADDIALALNHIVDDPDVFKKVASFGGSRVDWGDVKPIPGHSLVHLIALSDFEKTGCNRNGDAFESEVCQRLHPTFIKYAKLYRNHKVAAAKGETEREGGYGEGFVHKTAHNGDMGRTELLIAASHDKCADWLGKMEQGDPIAFSMGFNCYYDECSIKKCGHKAPTPKDYCEHVKKNASYPYGMGRVLADGQKCFVYNRKGYFNDISQVGTGADMTAFHLRKVASVAGEVGHVPSGAELGEMFIRRESEGSSKLALARKFSAMEKRIPAVGLPVESRVKATEPIGKKCASDLSSAPSHTDMFTFLVDRKVVLPFTEFFKVAMGDEIGEIAQDVEAASAKLAEAGGPFTWAESQGLTGKACEIATYDTSKSASTHRIDPYDESDLMLGFSVLPQFVAAREAQPPYIPSQKTASFGDDPALTPKQAALAVEYLAYKLSAVDGMGGMDQATCAELTF